MSDIEDVVEQSESVNELEDNNQRFKSKFSEYYDIICFNNEISGFCKLCEIKKKKKIKILMKNRNTSGLKKHLLSMHKKESEKLFLKKPSKSVANFFGASTSGQAANRTIDFTVSTVDWITQKYLSFSFFEDKETQEYFKLICPNLLFPKRLTLRRQVKDRFEQLRAQVKDQLQNCNSKMSFTIDGWKSIAGKSFYGITIHYIDNEWNYQSKVLDFVPSHGRHTGQDISSIFYKSLVEFKLEKKVQWITVDNASANTSFMAELGKLLPSFDSENQHFRCIAHILNLGVQDLMKNLTLQTGDELDSENELDSEDEMEVDQENNEDNTEDHVIINSSTAIMKLRSVFRKIRRSEKLKIKFCSVCDTVGVPTTLNPILDCQTRWNSTHDMLGVALKLKNGIKTLCSILPALNDLQISDTEWYIFDKVFKFLINFKILTTRLGGDKYVTLPQVIVSFNLLLDKVESTIKQLDEKIQRTAVDEQLILGFQAARDKILKHYNKTNWIYCVSLILDPRHKAETFDLTLWGVEIKNMSLQKFEVIYKSYYNQEPVLELPEQENHDIDSDEDIIDFNTLYSTPVTYTNSQNCMQELDTYLGQPRSASSENVLQWWKLNQVHFPVLAKMAKDFLSISATSVPAERLFSKASLVIRKHRNRLNNESAKWLLCINSWSKQL